MLPEKDRPKMHAVEVVAWLKQADVADEFRLTPRQVQNLERKGLPHDGSGASKRYPVPHCFVWFLAYRVRQRLGEVVERLPFEVAHAEHRAMVAKENGELRVRRRGSGSSVH